MGQEVRFLKIRVVLDTNVIVSALIRPGPTQRIADLWKNDRILPLISKQGADELLRVLTYPKFGYSKDEIQNLFERHFLAYAEPITIKKVLPVISVDSSDDVFLACAFEGHAKYLVSGDHHLLDLGHYKTIPIITVKEFLSKFLV